MAVREYDENSLGPVDVKSNELCTFVDYSNGCGKFVTSAWIDKDGVPFKDALSRFSIVDMSVNESKLLEIWKNAYGIYRNLESGIS
jgi:hypothetical protein